MELKHTLNRGVDKRKIFLDDRDRYRFIHDLYEFNDEALVTTGSYYFNRSLVIARRKQRQMLVDIHAFCLMPNHYHLLLSPKIENGIPRFMKKLNMGYARYFNERYNRSGALFEGRYKSVVVTDEAHFLHLPNYIHFNPLDLISSGWRDNKIGNHKRELEFLRNYRWSSYQDYIGIKNFSSVISRSFLEEVFGGSRKYNDSTTQWLREIDVGYLKDVQLEQ